MSQRSKVFIGSSVEGLNIAYAIQQNLTHTAEVTVWDQGVFELSQTTIESLINVLGSSDFGIFVFSPDDITKIRDADHLTVRDNVLFELGLFIGKLGRDRSFIIVPDKVPIHIPSDLIGITPGKYETNRSDGSMQAATSVACHLIRQRISSLGLIDKNIDNSATIEAVEVIQIQNTEESTWFDLFLDKDYEKALKILEEERIDGDKSNKLYENKLWQFLCKIQINKENILSIVDEFINNTDSEKAYTSAAYNLYHNDFVDKAFSVLEKGLEIYNNSMAILITKAEILFKEGLKDESITVLSSILDKSPDAVIRLAEIYEKSNQKDKALDVISEAFKIFPNTERVLFKYAEIASEQEKNTISLYLYDKLTRLNSSDPRYWGYLGNVCLNLSMYDKAMVAYKSAEKLSNGNQAWIRANIGNLLLNKGFYSDAKEHIQRALELDKESEYAVKRLSTLLELQSKEDEEFNSFIKDGKEEIRKYKKLIQTNEN